MSKGICILVSVVGVLSLLCSTTAQSDRKSLEQIEQSLKQDVPKILCLDRNFATGGQPSEAAYRKLRDQQFRSVLNLRTSAESIDLEKERKLAEQAGLRYIHVPVVSSAPEREQVPKFVAAVKDNANHPMLIHCGSANRVGAMWAIYRATEQGWPLEKAMEEAGRIGLTSPVLKKFVEDYVKDKPSR